MLHSVQLTSISSNYTTNRTNGMGRISSQWIQQTH
jgi:hypothetical protein